MYYIILALLVMVVPQIGHAATGSLQGLITGIGEFLDKVLIPVILGIAFLSLVWNMLRFFVIGATNEEGQQNAKNLAFYSVLAFVVILSFWGIVNVLTNGIGLPSSEAPCEDKRSDYLNKTNLAPCSSPRPQPRPTTGTDTGAGSIITLPIDTTTLPEVGAAEKLARDTSLTFIKSAASAKYADQFETLYGANKETVAAFLFPDLIFKQDTATDLDRLRGTYRLTTAGMTGLDNLTNYTNAVNAYATALGHPEQTISYNNITNVALPLPAPVVTNLTATKAAFQTAITEFNNDPMAGVKIPDATLSQLFDSTLTTDARVANFNSLMSSTYHIIITPELRDTFLQNINTENAFAGKFNKPQF